MHTVIWNAAMIVLANGHHAAARELGIDGVALGHLRCGPSVREDRTT